MSVRFSKFTVSLNRLSRLIRKLKMNGMKEFSLKGEQTAILYQLYEHQQGLQFSALVSLCSLDAALVSRNIKKLRELDYVDKTGEEGKYKALIYLTDKGRHLMKEVGAIIDQVESEAAKDISDSDLEIFYKVLDKITYNLENLPADWSNRYDSKDNR